MFRWSRPAAYAGTARYATENGEAGSAADDVREHWTRRQVSNSRSTPALAQPLGFSAIRGVAFYILGSLTNSR